MGKVYLDVALYIAAGVGGLFAGAAVCAGAGLAAGEYLIYAKAIKPLLADFPTTQFILNASIDCLLVGAGIKVGAERGGWLGLTLAELVTDITYHAPPDHREPLDKAA
ncbi:hypothetical protein KY331_00950 [Candidatus Woesearchaeota archaeon]|nr:hypothetical protein [Candidatus Woesearchaeota archaeon]